jgi:predicted NAD/FAD-dependent oxidoreductase
MYQFDHGAQYFTARDARFQKVVNGWLVTGTTAVWDASIAVIDNDRRIGQAESKTRYVGTPRMNAVVAALTDGLHVRFGTRVDRIRRETHVWTLTDPDGDSLGEFDGVLLAIPPVQATELLAQYADSFTELQTVVMAPCWTLMAAFDDRIDAPFDAAMIEHSPLSWVARNTSKPARSDLECWVLHGSPGWSREHIECSGEQVRDAMLAAFAGTVARDIPDPAISIAHRWRYARTERPLGVDSLWNADLSLGVCGDWCLGARIEAAFLSGLSLAERVVGSR